MLTPRHGDGATRKSVTRARALEVYRRPPARAPGESTLAEARFADARFADTAQPLVAVDSVAAGWADTFGAVASMGSVV